MQLYFIRHGQSENNALWDLIGGGNLRTEDPDLTDAGRQQARLLASYLSQSGAGRDDDTWDPQNKSGFGITHLYCSLMVRAASTGVFIAESLQIPLVSWLDIHEGGGIYMKDQDTGEPTGLPGNNRSYFEENYPNLLLPEDLGDDGWWNRPFETKIERKQRARRVIEEIWRRHGNRPDRVALISHGGFYNHFLSVLFEINWKDKVDNETSEGDMPTGRWFLMNNSAISRIDFGPDEISMVYQNRTEFLPNELIT